MVKLNATEAPGIRQTGLAMRKGKSYAGRVILAATPGTSVKLTLVWGSGASDRQTIVIARVGSEFRKFPLTFQVQAPSRLFLASAIPSVLLRKRIPPAL